MRMTCALGVGTEGLPAFGHTREVMTPRAGIRYGLGQRVIKPLRLGKVAHRAMGLGKMVQGGEGKHGQGQGKVG